jgi:hypothetical protein
MPANDKMNKAVTNIVAGERGESRKKFFMMLRLLVLVGVFVRRLVVVGKKMLLRDVVRAFLVFSLLPRALVYARKSSVMSNGRGRNLDT